jgi:hypothetical protein
MGRGRVDVDAVVHASIISNEHRNSAVPSFVADQPDALTSRDVARANAQVSSIEQSKRLARWSARDPNNTG